MRISHSRLTLVPVSLLLGVGGYLGRRRIGELSERSGAGIGTLSRAGAGLTNSWPSSQPRFPPLLGGAGTCSSHVKRAPLGREEAMPAGRAGTVPRREAGWGVGADAGRAG